MGLFLPLLPLIAFYQGQNPVPKSPDGGARTQEDNVEAKRRAWERRLVMILAKFETPVAIDVDVERELPVWSPYNSGDASLWFRLLAGTMLRKPDSRFEAWTMRRDTDVAITDATTLKGLVTWLDSVPQDELERLCSTGANFHDLSPATQEVFVRECDNPGRRQKMANGEFARTTVRLNIVANTVDRDGKARTLILDPFQRDLPKEERLLLEQESAAKPLGVAPRSFEWPKSPSRGPLAFGEGRLLALGEIALKAQAAFGHAFHYDGRMARSLYFLRGDFDEIRLLAALKEVGTPISFEVPVSDDAARKGLDRLIRGRIAEAYDDKCGITGLPISDALNGRKLDPKSLSAVVPGIEERLKSTNIDPNATFVLRPALGLTMTSSGSYRDNQRESPLGNRWSYLYLP